MSMYQEWQLVVQSASGNHETLGRAARILFKELPIYPHEQHVIVPGFLYRSGEHSDWSGLARAVLGAEAYDVMTDPLGKDSVLHALEEAGFRVSFTVVYEEWGPGDGAKPGWYRRYQTPGFDLPLTPEGGPLSLGEVLWQPIDTAPENEPVLIYKAEWVDGDFNPTGTVEGTLLEDGNWCGPFWDACQDTWNVHEHLEPTHWTPFPAPPTS